MYVARVSGLSILDSSFINAYVHIYMTYTIIILPLALYVIIVVYSIELHYMFI
jgi:hypothetical protein